MSVAVPLKPLFIAPAIKVVIEEPEEAVSLDQLDEQIDFYLNRLLDAYGMSDKKSVPRYKKTVRLS